MYKIGQAQRFCLIPFEGRGCRGLQGSYWMNFPPQVCRLYRAGGDGGKGHAEELSCSFTALSWIGYWMSTGMSLLSNGAHGIYPCYRFSELAILAER